MVARSLAALIAVALTFNGASRAQESPSAAAGSATASPPRGSSQAKPQSLGAKKDPSPSRPAAKNTHERATFGAGCFWHVEAVFERLDGVYSAVSGYAGGFVPYPSYEMVHEGTTGHAEAVMVDYDPNVISYEDLLQVFWKNHDPTSINRQGPDEGPQYRSVIFYHNEDQRKAALKSYQALTNLGVYRSPIVTQLMPMTAFYRAEDYHQDYYGGKPRASTPHRKTSASKVRKSQARPAKSAAPAKESASKAEETSPKP